jgi:aldehyde:ferredoxin oxidoreductase
VLALFKEELSYQSLREFGTAGYVNLSHMLGDLPLRYFQLGEYLPADDLSGVDLAQKFLRRNTSCHKCVIACGRETASPTYHEEKVDGPEYEAVAALGSLLMIFDLEAVIHAQHLCNLYGMDVISLGVTIGLACELFERGLLTAADTDGLEIRYGDPHMLFRLIDLTARCEGFGAILAEGNAALAEHSGAPELSATVNRLEVPMHDPRAYTGMGVTYALSPRGACHMQGDMYELDLGRSVTEDIGLVPGDRHESSIEKGRMAARLQAWRNLYNSLTLCEFQNPPTPLLASALNAATGWRLDPGDLVAAGKRIVSLKRLLNVKLGLTKADDKLPDLLLKPLQEGGSKGVVPDMVALLEGAYSELGWNVKTGHPIQNALL